MRRSLVLFFIFAVLLHAQVQPVRPAAQKSSGKPGSVLVTVLNSVTQQPVPDVWVRLYAMGPGESASEQTDANGRAQFTNVAPSGYGVTLEPRDGFTFPPMGRVLITVKESESVTVPALLLIPPGGIEGFVKDEDGKPVAGAEVEAMSFLRAASAAASGESIGPDYFATTDENGHYRVAAVRPGPTYVRVSMPMGSNGRGFSRTYYPGVNDVRQALRLQVLAGRDVQRADFRVRLSPGFHVRGRVSLPGPPQELPTLLIRPCDSVVTGTVADTGDDGTFDFTEMLPGTYCIRYQELRLSDNTIVSYASAEVTVVDRDVERVQLTPVGLQKISGTIQLEDGATMLRGQLAVSAIAAGVRGTTVEIDASGRFSIDSLFPGTYRLRVTTTSGYGHIKSARLGAQSIDPDSFRYAGESGPLIMRVGRATGILHGRITATSGVRLGGRVVVVTRVGRTSEITHTAVTNEQGEFTISGIIPGSYRVSGWEEDAYEWVRIPAFAEQFPGTAVTVKDHQQTEVETRLIPSAEVEKVKASF